MAEAAVQESAGSGAPKYYCHQCSTSVDLSSDLSELTCPKCASGFIEEITQDLQAENAHQRTSETIFDGNTMASLFSGLMFNPHAMAIVDDDADDDEDDDDGDDLFFSRWNTPRERLANLRRRGSRGTSLFGSTESRLVPRLIEHLLQDLSGTGSGRADGSWPSLASVFHGDVGDYAWGADGLDNAITQLLNQWENSGTPPASKEAIDGLQSVTITQEHVDKEMQCNVCMEEFNPSDTVRAMPCDHLYHTDCIVTWLKLHNTCPICRLSIDGETIDDVAAIQLPESADSSDEDNDCSLADQSTETDHAVGNSSSSRSGEMARDAVLDDMEDAAVTMEVDCANMDSLNGWSANNEHNCGESRAMGEMADDGLVSTSSRSESPLQVVNFEYWSDDYDSD